MENQDFNEIDELGVICEDYFLSTVYDDTSAMYNTTIDQINPQYDPAVPNEQKKNIPKVKKSTSESNTLCMFFKHNKPPKKEYIRCKLIRGHKRAIRQAIANKVPTTTIHKVNITNKAERKAWLEFAEHVKDKKNQPLLQEKSKTVNGPATDGVSQREVQTVVQREVVTPEVLRSFNDTFCRLYFSNEIVIESYVNYIEIIFADSDPQNLKKRFEFTCCKREDSESHYPECGEK